ncbi:hypothetical protein [Streptomyces sp. NPDC058674]|uniref:hypothetical protein n=1 Tax=Streptomyces sp. NPDC058674 TaxID=3346592 RepID=UPI003660DAAA
MMDGGTAPAEEPEGPPPPLPVLPARYRISAPGPVSGGVHGVGFANGHAVVTDPVRHARALAWFRAEPGYSVEEIDPPEPEAEAVAVAPEVSEETPAPEVAPEPITRRRR